MDFFLNSHSLAEKWCCSDYGTKSLMAGHCSDCGSQELMIGFCCTQSRSEQGHYFLVDVVGAEQLVDNNQYTVTTFSHVHVGLLLPSGIHRCSGGRRTALGPEQPFAKGGHDFLERIILFEWDRSSGFLAQKVVAAH
jgi:hypothetical protein